MVLAVITERECHSLRASLRWRMGELTRMMKYHAGGYTTKRKIEYAACSSLYDYLTVLEISHVRDDIPAVWRAGMGQQQRSDPCSAKEDEKHSEEREGEQRQEKVSVPKSVGMSSQASATVQGFRAMNIGDRWQKTVKCDTMYLPGILLLSAALCLGVTIGVALTLLV